MGTEEELDIETRVETLSGSNSGVLAALSILIDHLINEDAICGGDFLADLVALLTRLQYGDNNNIGAITTLEVLIQQIDPSALPEFSVNRLNSYQD